MTTSFSWIDPSLLPLLGDVARRQPLRNKDGMPTPGGLVCPAAALNAMAISLCVPVVHPMYESTVRRIAAATCGACNARAAPRHHKCSECGSSQPLSRHAFEADAVDQATWVRFGTNGTPPRHVLALRHVIAPQLNSRPSCTMPDGRCVDDDLTIHLASIVRADNRCRRTLAVHGRNSTSHAAARHNLQRAVHRYYGYKPTEANTGGAKQRHKSYQPSHESGLKHRLNGKTGRMRGSLLGWRLGEVARCVAQPAPPGFDVDVVIVPQAIAHALGNLQDNDVCLLNRQPTLGVGSIFAVRARVSRNPHSYVIQVSPWLCASLNLDFDVSAAVALLRGSLTPRLSRLTTPQLHSCDPPTNRATRLTCTSSRRWLPNARRGCCAALTPSCGARLLAGCACRPATRTRLPTGWSPARSHNRSRTGPPHRVTRTPC